MNPIGFKDRSLGPLLKMSSYRLAYWHAPKRARHEEDDFLDCVICKYQEGVALMEDVVGYLKRAGIPVWSHDDRSFSVPLSHDPDCSDEFAKQAHSKRMLYELISGLPYPVRP